MALGDLTKQLAEQAIRSAASKPVAPPQAENLGAAVLGQVQAMQKALKDDEELVVSYHAGGETIRVLEFYLPSGQLIVLSGADKDKNIARVISPADALQLICKVMKVQPPAKPARIGFLVPRAKSEPGS